MSSSMNIHQAAAESGSGSAFVERGGADVSRIGGTRKSRYRSALYPGVDILGALARPAGYSSTVDYRMSAEEAGQATLNIMRTCEVIDDSDSVRLAFVQAMCLCLSLNSSSVLMPGRAVFEVTSGRQSGKFSLQRDVIAPLGADARRYFRAYADEARGVLEDLRKVVAKGPIEDEEEEYEKALDNWNDIMRIAHARGLAMHPTLVHDSADACSDLTPGERMAIGASKKSVIDSIINDVVNNPHVHRSTTDGARQGKVVKTAGHISDSDY